MKKFLVLFLLLALSVTGVIVYNNKVNAANVPSYIDPQAGPEIWLTPVYVDTGSTALDVGDVVCWDMDASSSDNDNWVEQCTAADTYLVAGIVYPADIAAGATGTIAIRGPVQVDTVTSSLNIVNSLACSSATAGSARSCTTDAANIGTTVTANSGTSANVCFRCNR